MNKASLALGVALVALVVGAGGYFFPAAVSQALGEIGTRFPNGLSVGNSAAVPGGVAPTARKFTLGLTGDAIGTVNFGQCAIWSGSATITASTTTTVDCSSTGFSGGTLNGLTAGDPIFAVATTSLSTSFGGVNIIAAVASSTAGYVTLSLANQTGATFTWTNTASSTIRYLDLR